MIINQGHPIEIDWERVTREQVGAFILGHLPADEDNGGLIVSFTAHEQDLLTDKLGRTPGKVIFESIMATANVSPSAFSHEYTAFTLRIWQKRDPPVPVGETAAGVSANMKPAGV